MLQSVLGLFGVLALAWVFSSRHFRFPWRTVVGGLALQFLLGWMIFRFPGSREALEGLNGFALAVLGAGQKGADYLFGPLASGPGAQGSVGFIMLFQVFPVIVFISALVAVLYHLRLVQPVVWLLAKIFRRVLGISGAEALTSAANVFVGVEAALVVRPYLARMTRSELLVLLTCGMATTATGVLALYVLFLHAVFPGIAGHLLAASVLSIPAGVVVAKILEPETDEPLTAHGVPREDPVPREPSLMAAVISGALDGGKLVGGIVLLLLAVLGLVQLVDLGLALLPGAPTLVGICSWGARPLAWLAGVPAVDLDVGAKLLGMRVLLTEVVSYQELATLASNGGIHDPRTVVILSYALCGFAHVASVAVFVGGTAGLCPERRGDLAALGWKALLAATLATLMTGAIAGIFATGAEVVFTPK
jgi:CNT family concentrative nucleoside transporter